MGRTPGTEFDLSLMAVRVRSEYNEMPGLALTPWHASRLWNLDERVAESVLHSLVDHGFLRSGTDGRFRAVPPTRKQS